MSKAGDLISSQVGSLVAVASNAVGGFASAAIGGVAIRQNRSIAGIIPDVTIEESHRDELVITEHPVEQGAQVSDHAYKAPAEVIARYGWSNSNASLAGGVAGLLGQTVTNAPDVAEVYQTLLALQASRQPFDLITGKRVYNNMLIRSLQLHTDAATENALMVTAVMRQVILVDTQTTTLKPANQAQPQITAAIANQGTVAPVQRSSLLLRGAQALGLSP
ncbi:MAG: hypothetical protein KGH75_02465 [Rhodospirillales bacterium]|nr:hypothetical protein [Rhodospirillales bacterium]